MAALTRGKTAPHAGDVAALRAEIAQLRADNWLLARGLAKVMVLAAPGGAPASFRQIVTQAFPVYTHEQAARFEQILTDGPGGG